MGRLGQAWARAGTAAAARPASRSVRRVVWIMRISGMVAGQAGARPSVNRCISWYSCDAAMRQSGSDCATSAAIAEP
jgi:hypothetical protein